MRISRHSTRPRALCEGEQMGVSSLEKKRTDECVGVIYPAWQTGEEAETVHREGYQSKEVRRGREDVLPVTDAA